VDAGGGGDVVWEDASVRHLKGIIWDTLVFETSGGSNNLDVDGLRKEDAERSLGL